MSMTIRLSLIYAISAFSMLLLSILFLYWVLINSLQNEDIQLLVNETKLLQKMLSSQNMSALQQEVTVEPTMLGVNGQQYFSRIIDENGHIFIQTPGMEKFINATSAHILANQRPNASSIRWKAADGKLYLFKMTPFNSKTQPWLIQTAIDITHEDHIEETYQRYLIFVLFLGILLSAVMGIVTARRGLRPLRDITVAAERITAAQLHERIGTLKWPKELISLAIAFDNMLSRIEDSFKRLSQLSADLAHELRTPIHNLMGETELALSRPRPIEEYRQVLESNLEEYTKISRMIDSMLFLARAETPGAVIMRSSFNSRQLLEDTAEFFQVIAEENKIQITTEGEAILFADPFLVKRAVSNLLANALKNTPAQGTITMQIQQPNADQIQLFIRDNGVGIDPIHLPKLFDRFYRIDSSRTHHSGGTGLGLSIVKSIMDLHQGKIDLMSELGKGTTVILTFPLLISS